MRRAFSSVGGLLLVVAAFLLLAPTSVGGPASFLTVRGSSMSPRLVEGDLAIVRKADTYRVGDVAAYESGKGSTVLHRVTAVGPDSYTLKGDANAWTDGDHPTRAQMVGKLWFRVPRAGALLAGRRALVLGFILFALIAWPVGRSRSSRRRTRAPSPSGVRDVEGARTALWVAGLIAVAAAALALPAWTRSPSEPSTLSKPYTHKGKLDYAARTRRGPAYRDGSIRTGDPMFLLLVEEVDLHFAYTLQGDTPGKGVSGRIGLHAVLSDAENGWRRRVAIAAPKIFSGESGAVSGTLDLVRLRALITKLAASTGIHRSRYDLEIRPTVELHGGTLYGAPLRTTFAPTVPFAMSELVIAPPQRAAGASDPFAPTSTAGVVLPRSETRRVGPTRMSLPVPAARVLSGALLAVAAGLGLRARRRLRSTMTEDEAEVIRAHHAHLLISVSTRPDVPGSRIVDVKHIEDLIAVAERYARPILDHAGSGEDAFMVATPDVSFRYVVGREDLRPAASVENGSQPVLAYPPVSIASPPRNGNGP